MTGFADILRKHGREYLDQFKDKIPQNHLKAINDILVCRTKANGGKTFFCNECNHFVYSYHSCGNRNCNKCQNELSQVWSEKNKQRLLDLPHFLVTFTLPAPLRKWARSNQDLFYNILFTSAAEALQALAYDTKYCGGKLGMIAVLHTWARNLSFHPHGHFVVTGGGLFEDENIWLSSKEDFLLPVKALSKIFKAKFSDNLKKENEDIFLQIDSHIWKKAWVVHCQAVGSGEQALAYLARYIFRPAISNNNILSLNKGVVKFRFKNAQTKQWQVMKLTAREFIHRYLQHVLPKGFVKIRYYGLYAHAYKKHLKKIPVGPLVKGKVKQPDENKNNKNLLCSKCHSPLILVEEFGKQHFYSNGPPRRIVLQEAIYKKLITHNPDF